jgi:hypothetical protein
MGQSTEKFVTAAYKAQLLANKKWEEEQKAKDAAAERKAVKKDGLTDFYASMYRGTNAATGGARPARAPERPAPPAITSTRLARGWAAASLARPLAVTRGAPSPRQGHAWRLAAQGPARRAARARAHSRAERLGRAFARRGAAGGGGGGRRGGWGGGRSAFADAVCSRRGGGGEDGGSRGGWRGQAGGGGGRGRSLGGFWGAGAEWRGRGGGGRGRRGAGRCRGGGRGRQAQVRRVRPVPLCRPRALILGPASGPARAPGDRLSRGEKGRLSRRAGRGRGARTRGLTQGLGRGGRWVATPLGYVREKKEITQAPTAKKDAGAVLSARERFLQRKAEKEAAAAAGKK